MSSTKQFDIIISGAALAGASMALALSKLQKPDGSLLSIAVVETFPISNELPKSYDARVIALSHASASYLNELGVWPQLKNDAMAIKNIHISDCDYYGKARLYSEDYNVSALGFVSEMQAIGNAIISPLKQSRNVTFFAPDSISEITWQSEQVSVQLSSGESISANLLLGCDGGQSVCRSQAKIDSTVSDYQQVAIIANLTPEKPHNNRAFERFSEFGPIALLPMTDNRCSLVWTVKPEHVDDLLALSESEFSAKLSASFGQWLGEFTTIGKRFAFELKLVQANEQIHHRMALLGNAAHTLHPIAGQGFNLGMRDVAAMAKHIKQALANNLDIGSYQVLSEYASSRDIDHKQVIALTDSLVHLFSNKHTPLVVGRGIGLKVLNYVTPLKTALAQKTMGH
ncbi:MAG: 2-octaprenyl-6-methoxyphenyl hydroxylase [Thalassotalea sp.]|nr:2-octaprenyl-6-methoxyphenyl hydroxylase [Thalassotalea sp.]